MKTKIEKSKLEIIKRLQRREPGLILDLKTGEVYQVNNSEYGRGCDDTFICRLRRKEIPYRRELERNAREIEEEILRIEQENEKKSEIRINQLKLLPAQGEAHFHMWNIIYRNDRRYE